MSISKRDEFLQTRENLLGFKPQTEVLYNSNLPYADHIDKESNHALSTIKTNFARVVISRELRPGVTYWANQLTRYIRLYGLKFSKEDHALFVNLLFEIITIPNLESLLVEQLCNVLAKLLKKRELLTRNDLQLDWVPLYRLIERLTYSKMEPMGLEWIPSSMDTKLRTLVRNCRSYFSPESTQSMLNEWKPLLCPFDIVMGKAVKYFDMFLPTLVFDDKERAISWKLWANEFLLLWSSIQNGPSFEKNFVNLFARFAHNNIGYFDWSQYVKPVFTRTLRALSLPVGKLQHTTALVNQLPLDSLCLWIVSMMGGDLTKIVLENLKCLLKSTETFFHPSNFGKWFTNLFQFIQSITNKFVNRVFRERFKQRCWEPKIPTNFLIEDEDIETFVQSLKPVAFLTLYSKVGGLTAAKVLKNLACLRPDLILPTILDKSYVALSTLTEPHQVTACLSALSCVISPGICGYSETKRHILPLLFQCLPALDANDLPKSTVAFQFISTCLSRIPLVDCSAALQYHTNLSENDKEACLMTSQFEDFALQFFDRCFVLLEALNQGNESRIQESSVDSNLEITQSEGMSGMILVTSSAIVLQQASKPIFKLCLQKLFHFSRTHLLEGHLAMSTTATMCAVAVKANPAVGFEVFLPYFCNTVLQYFSENTDAINFEKVDKQLIWDLKMIAEISHVGTEYLIQYKDILFDVAQTVFQMLAKEAYEPAVKIMKFCIKSWTTFYTCDRKSIVSPDAGSDYFAFSDWGATLSPWNIKIEWHVPTEEEFEASFELMDQFLKPTLEKLHKFNEGEVNFTKEELRKLLFLAKEVLSECYLLLPIDNTNIVSLNDDSSFKLRSWPVHTVTTLPFFNAVLSKNDRKNLRAKVFNIASASLQKILLVHQDNVDAVCLIIDIYSQCFLMHEQLKFEFDQHWKIFTSYKEAMRNPFQINKQRDRFSHIDRTVLQQRMRILAVERSSYTTMHHQIMLDLINLSTSHYMKVRSHAQSHFFHGLSLVPSVAYKEYLPLILKQLQKQDGIDHHAFKGALYLLTGKKKSRLFLGCYQKWEAVVKVWPALINAPHSDKPSIARLYELLALKIQAHFVSLSIHDQMSDAAIQSALNLLKSQSFPSAQNFDTSHIIEIGKDFNNKSNQMKLNMYNQLVDDLIGSYESGKLTWKYSELVLGMLSLLLRHDVDIPRKLSSLFVSLLVDDAVSIRTLAVACIGSIMKQQKRKHAVEMLSLQEIQPSFASQQSEHYPGDRLDNAWLQYNVNDLPDTEEKFNSTKFVDKTHWGYFCWPQKLKMYASLDKQPPLDRSREELSPGEVTIFDHFTDASFVEQVVTFLCLENEKGKDKFDDKKMDMFRGLFRNFGDTFLPYFKPHVLCLVARKQESYQRCAAEMITGIVMGSKHWPFDKVSKMWSWLIPALQTAVSNISVETLKDWDMAFNRMVQNRDPRRIHWLLDFIVTEPSLPSNSALVESSKLYLLQGGIHQQEWRVPQLLQKMLEIVEPLLNHSYKNIRNRVGSVLASIFLYDVQLMNKSQSARRSPSIDNFIQRILPCLEGLLSEETPPLSNASSETRLSTISPSAINRDILNESDTRLPIASGTEFSEQHDSLPPAVMDSILKGLTKLLPPGSEIPELSSMAEIQEHLPPNIISILKGKRLPLLSGVDSSMEDIAELQTGTDSTRSEAVRVFKTVMKWLVSAQRSSLQPFKSDFIYLLPLICKMYPVDHQAADEELHRDTRLCLSCIAQSFVNDEDIMKVVESIDSIATHGSWHARHTVLSYIQVFVFTNLFSVRANKGASIRLRNIVLNLLQDEQYEVSRMGSITLSGLIQCEAIPMDAALLELAHQFCRTRLKKKSKVVLPASEASAEDENYQKRLLKRHAGVLILSACALSSPYTVPDWLPGLVMCLSEHLHDPQPIQGTIKRTLSDFRRTHHDSWHEDKEKFTSDELAVLTDLLVSPSYYA